MTRILLMEWKLHLLSLLGAARTSRTQFSDAINDADFPENITQDARSALKGMVDDAFRMANDIGEEGVKQLESVLNDFRSGYNKKHAESRSEGYDNISDVSGDKKKRKLVPIPYDK